MKKNGFIATSILYSFFLVFITLFVALVANYLHNRILLSQIDEAARETLYSINNLKLTDLVVGEHIKFATDSTELILNPDATWTVAHIETNGDNKTYYFISDLTAQNMDVYYKLPTDKITKFHPMTVDLYNKLKSSGAYSNAMLYDGFDINIPTTSFLSTIRNSNINAETKKKILNAGGSYIVYSDSSDMGYEKDAYYELRAYSFSSLNSIGEAQAKIIIPNYCGGSFDGTQAVYNTSNTFGYISVEENKDEKKYVDFCYYASPIAYTHNSNENVVSVTESKESDKIISTYNSTYNYRLVADITLNVNSTNTYIIGGRGTYLDPYLFTNGVKQS